MTTIHLKELAKEAEEFLQPYNSKVTPISKKDNRIYILIVQSDSEATALNKNMKRVAILINDDIPTFIEENADIIVKTDPNFSLKYYNQDDSAIDDPEDYISGIAYYFDGARR